MKASKCGNERQERSDRRRAGCREVEKKISLTEINGLVAVVLSLILVLDLVPWACLSLTHKKTGCRETLLL